MRKWIIPFYLSGQLQTFASHAEAATVTSLLPRALLDQASPGLISKARDYLF